jgi:hypothetical protein
LGWGRFRRVRGVGCAGIVGIGRGVRRFKVFIGIIGGESGIWIGSIAGFDSSVYRE